MKARTIPSKKRGIYCQVGPNIKIPKHHFLLREPEKKTLHVRRTPSIITPIFGQQFENATGLHLRPRLSSICETWDVMIHLGTPGWY